MSRVRELLEQKKKEIKARKHPILLEPHPPRALPGPRRFHIFAEIKRSSLSAGVIRPSLDLAPLAAAFQSAGASVLSVLTEEHYFGGSLQDLRIAKQSVNIPILQKDFIIDPYQILEAKEAGADFILLIVRFLTDRQLKDFLRIAEDNRLHAILEITDEADIARLPADAKIVGVNSRDLESLTIDISKFQRLRPLLPSRAFLIAESGIQSLQQVQMLIDLGYQGALIGEHFLRCVDPAEELARFTASVKTKVKICGITSEADAWMAIQYGASALGFIFAESPRKIDPFRLAAFRDRLPDSILKVGVFKDQAESQIRECMNQFRLDIAQIYGDIPIQDSWQATIITGEDQITRKEGNVLWDIKCEPEKLERIWSLLHKPFAVAGGLHAENVARVIEICKPQWVDTARGVESVPGKKDSTKLESLMKVIV